MYKEYKKQLAKDGSGEGDTKSARQFKTMQTIMRNLRSQAKEDALMYGRLSEDEGLIEQQMQRTTSVPLNLFKAKVFIKRLLTLLHSYSTDEVQKLLDLA